MTAKVTMALPPVVTTDQQTLPPNPHRKCRRTSRATIEAELFNLRSRRNGFVRSESLRLSPRSDDAHDDERIIHDRSRGRRWRRKRCDNGERNLIEKIREVARRAKVMELRLVGRRSWWPQFDGKRSKVAMLPSPTKTCTGTVNGSTKKENKETKSTKGRLLVNFPAKRKQSSFNFDQLISDPTTKVSHIQSGKRKNPLRFWKFKENMTTLCESDDTECSKVIPSPTLDNTPTAIEPGEKPEQEKGADGKKKRNIIPAIATAASVSSLGIAVAIILL
eukprot:CAMPEP_0172324194 /NCGR_PEP_ID=MMETSP1058-20130122/50697_1 /TAXON_ID=83371 /ORGANISM="Detonula confervacea, Strain CCMP 353" /LENGTH=276 /DNA_ID=CAMNT_0013040397 /DNA_START=203 /DNA_END=1033 /DNA_ORIENTATION=+